MRTPVLTALLGLSLFACAGEITGGGDDDVPENCGNGAVDTGETCDDSNTVDGDGCSATCTTEISPRLDATVDKTAIDTQLMRGEVVIATLTSGGDFSGPVNIAATVTDELDAPFPLITFTGPTTLSLTAGQSMPANFVLTIPSNATGTPMNAKFKLNITSAAGNHDFVTTLAITPTLIISYEAATGINANNHPVLAGKVTKNITVKRGATVGYKNDDTIQHITHGGGIFPHETINDTTGLAGATYSLPTTQAMPGSTGTLGCHSHDSDTGYASISVE